MGRALLVAVVVLGACGGAVRNDGGVDVTLHFGDSLDDAALDSVDELAVHASGDETGDYLIPVSALQRTERFVYRPKPATHALTLTIDALSKGNVVGDGASITLEVNDGKQATSSIDVAAASMPDLSVVDEAMPDLGSAPDLEPPPAPRFVSISNAYGAMNAADPPVALPPGTQAGDFLFATVYVFDQNTVITPPVGWTLYQTIVGTATSFRTSWYYRVADGSEPVSVVFSRSPSSEPIYDTVSAYRGTLATSPLDPGSGSPLILSGNPYSIPSIDVTGDHTLLVATWISDSGTTPTWTQPAGMVARREDTILVADEPQDPAGMTGALVATCTASLDNGTAGLVIALRSH